MLQYHRIKWWTFLFPLLFIVGDLSYAQDVYVTKTGSKYHSEGCRYLSRSSIPISLEDAIARGYTACSVCNPGSKTSFKKDTDESDSDNVQSKKSTQSISVQCSATTKSGRRCKRMTTNSNGRCWQHQ